MNFQHQLFRNRFGIKEVILYCNYYLLLQRWLLVQQEGLWSVGVWAQKHHILVVNGYWQFFDFVSTSCLRSSLSVKIYVSIAIQIWVLKLQMVSPVSERDTFSRKFSSVFYVVFFSVTFNVTNHLVLIDFLPPYLWFQLFQLHKNSKN